MNALSRQQQFAEPRVTILRPRVQAAERARMVPPGPFTPSPTVATAGDGLREAMLVMLIATYPLMMSAAVLVAVCAGQLGSA